MYDISQNPVYLHSVHRTSGERSKANGRLVFPLKCTGKKHRLPDMGRNRFAVSKILHGKGPPYLFIVRAG